MKIRKYQWLLAIAITAVGLFGKFYNRDEREFYILGWFSIIITIVTEIVKVIDEDDPKLMENTSGVMHKGIELLSENLNSLLPKHMHKANRQIKKDNLNKDGVLNFRRLLKF